MAGISTPENQRNEHRAKRFYLTLGMIYALLGATALALAGAWAQAGYWGSAGLGAFAGLCLLMGALIRWEQAHGR